MLQKIEQALPAFSHTERRVADWVLAHPRRAADATLASVARESNASEPSVIRFCRRIGLSGFRELTRRLTEALSQPAPYVYRNVNPDDSTADAATKVLDASIQTLVGLRGRLSMMPLEKAASAMQHARQIVFAGLGASAVVARDAYHKFFRLGIPCATITDTPSLLQFAAITASSDVLVVASHKGAWSEFSKAAQIASKRGACVIAVTDPASPLAQSSTLVLACEIAEDTSVYTPMASRLAHLAVLDALHVALALKLGSDAEQRLKQTKAVLDEHLAADHMQ